MNLKTTFFLILLTGGAVGGWYYLQMRKPAETAASPTADFLAKLPVDKLTRIEVSRQSHEADAHLAAARTMGLLAAPFGPLLVTETLHPRGPQTLFVLEKSGAEWNLPGNWPVRPVETNQWLALLTNLKSRFTPISLNDSLLSPFGLDDAPLTIIVTAGKESHTLRFGEEPGDTNRFTRSTFVRLDNEKEVLRLGPGVYGALNRSLDYFRQRRLFPHEHVAKDDESLEKADRLKATEVEVATENTKMTLEKKDKDWLIKDAYKKDGKEWTKTFSKDRADPGRSDALVRAFPDLWAEKFIELKSLEECGLKEPVYTLTVTRAGGGKTKLFIGNISRTSSKFQIKKGPMPIPMETKEEFRYAKLEKNDQIFEIKTDKLDDITLSPPSMRDPNLARFKVADVKRLEIRHGDETLVFAKVKDDSDSEGKKEKWRMEKPHAGDVEAKAVEEFLDKLESQQARDGAVLDKADLKEVGLDKPAGNIKLTLEEGKDDKKKTRTIAFALGVKNKEKDKVYVKVDQWPRVNELPSDIWTLAQRSELAYRPRELWKLDADAITRITIEADGKPYSLERSERTWKITGPLEAEAGGREPDNLADELAHLRVERFEAKKPTDLAKFGLDKPAFKITVIAKDKKQHTLEIGKREDSKDGGRFARVEGGDTVFVLNEKLAANFKADASDWLDKGLTSINPDDIEKIQYGGANPFTLEKKKGDWQVVSGKAQPLNVEKAQIASMLLPWQKLRAEKIVATGKKIELAKFGLEKPTTTITVTTAGGEPGKTKDIVVELGSESKDGGRFARFDKKDTVVVLNTFIADQLNRSYLDFVDPRMIRPFDLDAVSTIERKMPGGDFEMARRDDSWNLVKPGLREADNLTVFDLLQRISGLTAKRIETTAAKDLAQYGLDKPAAVVTFLFDDGKKHVIKVGKAIDKTKGEKDERFAMVDDKQMVIVLSVELSRHLVAAPLYFADRNLASFANADTAELTRGSRKLTFKREDGWQIVAPIKADADKAGLDELIRFLQRLRADEIVADKGADLKKYGLDKPAAEWRLKSGSDEQLHLLIGAPENSESDARRYAKLGNRNAVFLLNPRTTARLMAEYRDRKVWPTFDGDMVEELSVTGPDGQFTLKKKGNAWTVAGKTDAKVKEAEVHKTLNILESLRAHHYVADAKADLKQYGLEKPAWKLEVPTPKGKRELWIGGAEDKSTRHFATVAGSGAVFVIDDVDNIILARPLARYVEEKKN